MTESEQQAQLCNSQFIKSEIKILRLQTEQKTQQNTISYKDIANIVNNADYPSLLSKILIQINDIITQDDVKQTFIKTDQTQQNLIQLLTTMKTSEFIEKYFKQSMRRDLFKNLQNKYNDIYNQSTIPDEAVIYLWAIASKIEFYVENEKIKKALNQISNSNN